MESGRGVEPCGKTLLAQSMVDNALSVWSFDGKSLKARRDQGQRQPEGLRTAEH